MAALPESADLLSLTKCDIFVLMAQLLLMTVAEIFHQPSQVTTGLDAAMGNVSASAKALTDSLLAKVGNDAAELGRGPQALASGQSFLKNLSILCAEAKSGRSAHMPELKAFAPKLDGWLKDVDSGLTTVDEIELRYQSLSREGRRKHATKLAMARKIALVLQDIKGNILDFLEAIDPTPDNYLDALIVEMHGDHAESLISSFETLSSSENFTTDAFKRRHNLK